MSNKSSCFFVGIDVGSSRTKLVVLNKNKKIIAWNIRKSGLNFENVADSCFEEIIKFLGLHRIERICSVSTGYGRKSVSFAKYSRTEIACHAKGCFYYFPFAIDIVDIGGQDNKIIKLDDEGKRVSFTMNRKCAAGTGAFLEEMSIRLNISLKEMNYMASKANDIVNFGSYCTVFSSTEVLESIKRGSNIKDISKGLFYSVIKRIMEMDIFLNKVVLTGGVVAHNPYFIEVARKLICLPIFTAKLPQLTGALGAALYAME